MAEIDFNSLELPELKRLQKEIAKAISSFEERKKAEALAALEERAKEFGFRLEDLTGLSTARKRSPSTAKYAHPENPQVTWPGPQAAVDPRRARGRQGADGFRGLKAGSAGRDAPPMKERGGAMRHSRSA